MKTGEKKILVLLTVITVLLAAAVVVLRFMNDRTGPVVTVKSDLTYHNGITEEELLDGVTARDNKDGDVSDSLRVTAIYPGGNDGQAVVIYMAKDSQNNVTKYIRILDVEAGATVDSIGKVPTDTSTDTETEPESAEPETESVEQLETESAEQPETESAEQPETESAEQPETEAAAADPETAARESAEADIAALAPAAPVLRLKQYTVTIPVGSTFNQLSYLENVTDDKDTREMLYRQIMIEGSVNPAAAGTYELTYWAKDTDGNRSNRAKLTVTVQ